MSGASPSRDERIALPERSPLRWITERSTPGAVVTPVRAVGFWVAVAAPLAYLPLLARGIDESMLAPLCALLAVHALSLVVGHGYGSR